MKKHISRYVQELLKIVAEMEKYYPEKKFTLDGRLVGDIGEVLAAEKYLIELNEGLTKHHDAICLDGTKRRVQIKTTMKESLTFPCDHVPDFFIGIKIDEKGKLEEIYNGPGKIIKTKIKNRKITKTNLHSISNNTLKKLNLEVELKNKIPKRIIKKR